MFIDSKIVTTQVVTIFFYKILLRPKNTLNYAKNNIIYKIKGKKVFILFIVSFLIASFYFYYYLKKKNEIEIMNEMELKAIKEELWAIKK